MQPNFLVGENNTKIIVKVSGEKYDYFVIDNGVSDTKG